MFNIKQSTDYRMIVAIITHPALYKLTYGQETRVEDFKLDTNKTYYLASKDNNPVGVFEVEPLTKITFQAHMALLPTIHGKGSRECVLDALKHMKETTEYKKVFVPVPISSRYVIKVLKDLNFDLCGYMKQAVIYNDKLTDLLLFDFDLSRL